MNLVRKIATWKHSLNELKVLLQGKAHPEQPEDVNVLSAKQSAPRHPRSVFLVDLPHNLKGTAAACLLSGEESVAKAISTVAVLVVEEEPKHLSPVLTVEAWVMWPVSVPRHI